MCCTQRTHTHTHTHVSDIARTVPADATTHLHRANDTAHGGARASDTVRERGE